MLRRLIALLIPLWLLACSGERRYSVEMPAHLDLSALDSEHAARMLAAADLWYVATDGGVDLTGSGNGYAMPVTMAAIGGGRIGETHNRPLDATYMFILLDDKGGTEPADLQAWSAAHELGHALGLQHADTGLMVPVAQHRAPCVDTAALALVCAEYACGPNAHATCD